MSRLRCRSWFMAASVALAAMACGGSDPGDQSASGSAELGGSASTGEPNASANANAQAPTAGTATTSAVPAATLNAGGAASSGTGAPSTGSTTGLPSTGTGAGSAVSMSSTGGFGTTLDLSGGAASMSSSTGGSSSSLPSTGQISGIASGAWDDNANYREFLQYLSSAPVYDRVDVSNRQFIVVRDAAGQAVANCPVTIADRAGHGTTLTTYPSGRTPLFPRAVGLEGTEIGVSATCLGTTATTVLDVSGVDGVARLDLPALRTTPDLKPVDLVFVLDTTGSMSEEIQAIKTTVSEVAARLGPESGLRIRIGMVVYRDYGDEYVNRVFPFTTDLAQFQASIAGVVANGGADEPEAINEALHVVSGLDWDPSAFARMAFLVGDAPPHPGEQYSATLEMKALHARGIKLFTVAASGQTDVGQAIFRQLAQYTYAVNLFILAGGAGPASTGGGEPITHCGSTQAEYTTGKLHELIIGQVLDEIALYDADPLVIPGLYQDANPTTCGTGGAGGAAAGAAGAAGEPVTLNE